MSNWEITPDAVAPPEHIILLVLPEMSQIHQRFHREFADVQKQGYAPLSEAHVERDDSDPDNEHNDDKNNTNNTEPTQITGVENINDNPK